jgi:hypothetical protein
MIEKINKIIEKRSINYIAWSICHGDCQALKIKARKQYRNKHRVKLKKYIPKIIVFIYEYILYSEIIHVNKKSGTNSITFIQSANQENAIRETIGNAIDVVIKGKIEKKASFSKEKIKIIFFILMFRIQGAKIIKKIKKELDPEIYVYYGSHIYWYIFFLISFEKHLQRLKPTKIVFTNDHTAPSRALLDLAIEKVIQTFYIQHASVTEIFPKLEFDVAMLYGMDALETYLNIEKKSSTLVSEESIRKVYLVGKPTQNTEHKKYKKIGIAVNPLTNIEKIDKLIEALTKRRNIIVRFHPGQSKGDIEYLKRKYSNNTNVQIQLAQDESIYDFLSKVDIIISGNSSIILDAALSGVIPFYLSDNHGYDYYGFINNGIAISDREIDILDLLSLDKDNLNNIIQKIEKNTKYYSETVGSKHKGRECELYSCILENSKVAEKKYFKKMNCAKKLKIYRLR